MHMWLHKQFATSMMSKGSFSNWFSRCHLLSIIIGVVTSYECLRLGDFEVTWLPKETSFGVPCKNCNCNCNCNCMFGGISSLRFGFTILWWKITNGFVKFGCSLQTAPSWSALTRWSHIVPRDRGRLRGSWNGCRPRSGESWFLMVS